MLDDTAQIGVFGKLKLVKMCPGRAASRDFSCPAEERLLFVVLASAGRSSGFARAA
jgi:hypothetical protein